VGIQVLVGIGYAADIKAGVAVIKAKAAAVAGGGGGVGGAK